MNACDLGWERWEEEDYFAGDTSVKAYILHHNANTYMLTHSTMYTKIIVKGSTKEKNITLFQAPLHNTYELEYVMKQHKIQ